MVFLHQISDNLVPDFFSHFRNLWAVAHLTRGKNHRLGQGQIRCSACDKRYLFVITNIINRSIVIWQRLKRFFVEAWFFRIWPYFRISFFCIGLWLWSGKSWKFCSIRAFCTSSVLFLSDELKLSLEWLRYEHFFFVQDIFGEKLRNFVFNLGFDRRNQIRASSWAWGFPLI